MQRNAQKNINQSSSSYHEIQKKLSPTQTRSNLKVTEINNSSSTSQENIVANTSPSLTRPRSASSPVAFTRNRIKQLQNDDRTKAAAANIDVPRARR